MKRRLFTRFAALALATLFIASGCFPRQPSRTSKPDLDVTPWTDHSVRGESGTVYRYMKLAGPSPDAPLMLLVHGGIFDYRIWYYTQDLATRYNVVALEMPDNTQLYTARVSDQRRILSVRQRGDARCRQESGPCRSASDR